MGNIAVLMSRNYKHKTKTSIYESIIKPLLDILIGLVGAVVFFSTSEYYYLTLLSVRKRQGPDYFSAGKDGARW
ncbi:Uncharacterised protein [Streptococcus downei MFe28]|uniref:Uncharacterized protein n=1 Tax=Streptococcus downei MFe28 TaxID=764290 RepID=A0A380JG33_STRDO|nr:Uncharacterised protein [Streptococcus downei MFe28]